MKCGEVGELGEKEREEIGGAGDPRDQNDTQNEEQKSVGRKTIRKELLVTHRQPLVTPCRNAV